MSVVVLRWNPEISSFRMENFKNAMKESQNTQNYMLNWSVWEHEKVHCGDRFFFASSRFGQGWCGYERKNRL